MLTSGDLFHEDLEVAVFTDWAKVVDDVLVFQSGMQRDLLM